MTDRKPLLVVFAGPNGSGKSTISTNIDNTGKEPWRIFRKHKDEPFKVFPNEYWSEENILNIVLP